MVTYFREISRGGDLTSGSNFPVRRYILRACPDPKIASKPSRPFFLLDGLPPPSRLGPWTRSSSPSGFLSSSPWEGHSPMEFVRNSFSFSLSSSILPSHLVLLSHPFPPFLSNLDDRVCPRPFPFFRNWARIESQIGNFRDSRNEV